MTGEWGADEYLRGLRGDPRLLSDPAGSSCSSLQGQRVGKGECTAAWGPLETTSLPLGFPLAADEAAHPVFTQSARDSVGPQVSSHRLTREL